jgi:DnaK suppressor protein
MKTESHSKRESNQESETFRRRLLAELQTHQERVNRARNELALDSDPEDDAGVASRSAYREATMGKLERDLQTIVEIERALRRLEEGHYTTCVGCESRIPEPRLKAIPWTRTCIECASGRSKQFGPSSLNFSPTPAH